MFNLNLIQMKKKVVNAVCVFVIAATLSSCATVLGGAVSECQRTKPAPGEPVRAIRGGALVADILLFWPGVIVDFATGAIYKPCDK